MKRKCNRLFILGAGFSKAAGMPLATDLTKRLIRRIKATVNEDCKAWLKELLTTMKWMSRTSTALNIEQFFDYARFDIERWRMNQQRCPVGRHDGPATDWNRAEAGGFVCGLLEEELVDYLWRKQANSLKLPAFQPIRNFAANLRRGDNVITFNYDLLLESALDHWRIPWCHGLADLDDNHHVVVLKMHGSLNWLIWERGRANPEKLTLLYSKKDVNVENKFLRNKGDNDNHIGEFEYDYELYRLDDRKTLQRLIKNRDGPRRDGFSSVGVAGLGSYKPLSCLPGSGFTWAKASGALRDADEIYIVGFSLSSFDGMARLLIAEAMAARAKERRLPSIHLVDPNALALAKDVHSVFGGPVCIECSRMEDVKWKHLLGGRTHH